MFDCGDAGALQPAFAITPIPKYPRFDTTSDDSRRRSDQETFNLSRSCGLHPRPASRRTSPVAPQNTISPCRRVHRWQVAGYSRLPQRQERNTDVAPLVTEQPPKTLTTETSRPFAPRCKSRTSVHLTLTLAERA